MGLSWGRVQQRPKSRCDDISYFSLHDSVNDETERLLGQNPRIA